MDELILEGAHEHNLEGPDGEDSTLVRFEKVADASGIFDRMPAGETSVHICLLARDGKVHVVRLSVGR